MTLCFITCVGYLASLCKGASESLSGSKLWQRESSDQHWKHSNKGTDQLYYRGLKNWLCCHGLKKLTLLSWTKNWLFCHGLKKLTLLSAIKKLTLLFWTKRLTLLSWTKKLTLVYDTDSDWDLPSKYMAICLVSYFEVTKVFLRWNYLFDKSYVHTKSIYINVRFHMSTDVTFTFSVDRYFQVLPLT